MDTARKNIEIRLGGVGGQGIALAGTLLCRAAALYDDKEAVFTQTHGPEARGGASRADVIIGDQPVAYPFVTRPDVLAVLFPEAYEKFRPDLKPGGLLITEADLVKLHEDDRDAVQLPVTRIATDIGSKVVTNIVLLGYLVGATGVVSRKAIEQAIRETVNPEFLDLDMRALDAGFDLVGQGAGNG